MSFRDKLRDVVENNTSKKGKLFDNIIQLLIILSLISFSIDTLPNKSSQLKEFLSLFELVCVVLFSIEYFLRIFVAEKPFRYLFSFYGLIDFFAIVPFYLSGILDLRFLRIFRIFRVFRAFKLIRYNKAIDRFGLAFKYVKEEVILFLIVTAVMIFITSAGIYYFEKDAQPEVFKSVFHSAWWSVVTLTTVGYGDVYPITTGGRIFTFFVLLTGVGLITVPAGLIASALSKAREFDKEKD